MAKSLSPALLQSRLFYITLALGVVSAVITVNVAVYVFSTIQTFQLANESQFSPRVFYSSPQNVSFFGSMLLNSPGKVIEYTTVATPTNTSALVVSGGEEIEIGGTPPVFSVGLRDRSIVPGTYECAQIEATSTGLIVSITNGTPFAAETVTHGVGTVADALSSSFLTHASAPQLTAPVVLSLKPEDFIINTATPGLYQVSLVASSVETQTCTHPVFISFADGVKVNACVSGPAPGTPGGAVPLDGSGVVPSAFLPSVMESRYRGLWNAFTNTPTILAGDCMANSAFYYTVSFAGNVTLGSFFSFNPRDLVVCVNGVWSQIACTGTGVDSFNGRLADVVPISGDYPPSLIPFNNGTLQDFADAPLVVWQATPLFPNAEILVGVEQEIQIVDAQLSLKKRFNASLGETNATGYTFGLEIDHAGVAKQIGSAGSPVVSITGTPNQILASSGPNVTLSLAQNWATNSDVDFRSFTIGAKQIVSNGASPIHFPDVGVSSTFMTEGDQTADGVKTLQQRPVFSDKGIKLQRSANDGSITIRPSDGMASNMTVTLPPVVGGTGQAFQTNGAGTMNWATFSNLQWVSFTPTVTSTGNIVSTSDISGFYTGSTTPGSLIEMVVWVRVVRSNNNFLTTVTFTVPTNVQTTLVTAVRGRVVENGPDDMYGFVRQGFGGNEIRFDVRATTGSKNGYLFGHFFYVVA